MGIFTAAAIQMRSGTEPRRNAADFEALVREAARNGATYVQTPEMTGAIVRDKEARALAFKSEERDEIALAARRLSAELGIYLHVGSTADRQARRQARQPGAAVYSPQGALVARYDKIHMFDVDLDNGESWRESAAYEPGTEAVVADIGTAKVGLADLLRSALSATLPRRGAWPAPTCSPCRPPSPARPARRTGTCCCAPARSRTAPSSSPRRRAGCTRTAARPMAIR